MTSASQSMNFRTRCQRRSSSSLEMYSGISIIKSPIARRLDSPNDRGERDPKAVSVAAIRRVEGQVHPEIHGHNPGRDTQPARRDPAIPESLLAAQGPEC